MSMARIVASALLLVCAAMPATAQRVHTDHDSAGRIVPRQNRTDARFSILSENRNATLLLMDTTIVIQLTDKGLDEIGEPRDEDPEGNSLPMQILRSMLQGGLKALLDRGIEYPLSQVREARYEDGRLVIENQQRERVFDGIEINDVEILASFSERDARAFAEKVREAKQR